MNKPVCVVTHWIHPEVIDFMAPHCELVLNQTRESLPRQALFARLSQADAAMMFMPDWVDDELLDHAPRLRVIGAALKGFDNFDVEAVARRGIWLTNVEDLLTIPTAELTIGLMLALGRHMLSGDRLIRSGGFEGWRPLFYGVGLEGSTIGLVGLGRLGQAVAKRLQGWEASVLGFDVNPLAPALAAQLGVRQVGLDELCARSDFTVLLTPLTSGTRRLFNAERIATIKPGAHLINAGRGSCVDEAAVAQALAGGRLAGYAADVFEFEDWILRDRPASIARGLLEDADRTVFTPHLGSAVDKVRAAIAMEAAENIVAALHGERPKGAVNEPTKQPGRFET